MHQITTLLRTSFHFTCLTYTIVLTRGLITRAEKVLKTKSYGRFILLLFVVLQLLRVAQIMQDMLRLVMKTFLLLARFFIAEETTHAKLEHMLKAVWSWWAWSTQFITAFVN